MLTHFLSLVCINFHRFPSISYLRFPFDVKNLIGYLISFLLQYIMISFSIFFVSSLMSLLIGSDFMFAGLTKDLENELNSMGESVENGDSRCRIVAQYCGFIQFHSESKQLSEHFGHLMELLLKINVFFFRLVHMFSAAFKPNAILILFWAITGICNSMLMLHFEIV